MLGPDVFFQVTQRGRRGQAVSGAERTDPRPGPMVMHLVEVASDESLPLGNRRKVRAECAGDPRRVRVPARAVTASHIGIEGVIVKSPGSDGSGRGTSALCGGVRGRDGVLDLRVAGLSSIS